MVCQFHFYGANILQVNGFPSCIPQSDLITFLATLHSFAAKLVPLRVPLDLTDHAQIFIIASRLGHAWRHRYCEVILAHRGPLAEDGSLHRLDRAAAHLRRWCILRVVACSRHVARRLLT